VNPDIQEVFQCDYCGKYAPLPKAVMAWAEDWQTDDERIVFTVSVACSPYCAEKVNSVRVAR
jgi:hypothetical protein